MDNRLSLCIYVNGIPLLILLIFLWLVSYNPIFDKKQKRLFLLASWVDIFMLLAISLNYLSLGNELPYFWILRKFTTFLNFAVSPVIPLLLYKISHINENSKIIYIPFIANVLLCTLSLFNGMIFFVNNLNQYGRGDFFFLPFMTVVIYLAIIMIQSKSDYLRGKRYERIFLIFVIALLITGLVLEIGFRFQFLSWVCASLSLPLYYLLLNINHSILDPLTGAYNRLMYTKELSRIENKKFCVIALLDINDFKTVNDTKGHDVGDEYLKKLTKIISQSLSSAGSLYRIGGDEFVILSMKEKAERIQILIEEGRKKARDIQIEFSYGIGYYEPDMVMSEFLPTVDQIMYRHKKEDKEKKGI